MQFLHIGQNGRSIKVVTVAGFCASSTIRQTAVLITVRVAGSQQDLNLRPVNRSPMLYPAELCEPVYPLE